MTTAKVGVGGARGIPLSPPLRRSVCEHDKFKNFQTGFHTLFNIWSDV